MKRNEHFKQAIKENQRMDDLMQGDWCFLSYRPCLTISYHFVEHKRGDFFMFVGDNTVKLGNNSYFRDEGLRYIPGSFGIPASREGLIELFKQNRYLKHSKLAHHKVKLINRLCKKYNLF